MKLILFDIDGTILLTGGAAVRAVNRAFEKLFRIPNAMDGIRADGKTDPIILREIFNRNLGRDYEPEEASIVYKEYVLFLGEEITDSSGFKIMPGVTQLIKTLSIEQGLTLGLATGNIEEGARIKLKRTGLDSYFKFGGFGSDSEERNQLIRIAIERGKALFNHKKEFEAAFVIGDTPFDIIHGREAGAKVVAVATGSYSARELEKYDPDFLFEDFSDFKSVLKIF
ncbi:MAG TPA: HAD family hydrolase [Thermodesulfobacteriota bacterium]|nr:HAD family hydrolase [Thermodesulfobacteriota bacterium]